jgi:hypothetical protein
MALPRQRKLQAVAAGLDERFLARPDAKEEFVEARWRRCSQVLLFGGREEPLGDVQGVGDHADLFDVHTDLALQCDREERALTRV